MHEVTYRLDTVPSRTRIAEEPPGLLRKQLRFAVTASLKKLNGFIRLGCTPRAALRQALPHPESRYRKSSFRHACGSHPEEP
jgi:hypothetical protein